MEDESNHPSNDPRVLEDDPEVLEDDYGTPTTQQLTENQKFSETSPTVPTTKAQHCSEETTMDVEMAQPEQTTMPSTKGACGASEVRCVLFLCIHLVVLILPYVYIFKTRTQHSQNLILDVFGCCVLFAFVFLPGCAIACWLVDYCKEKNPLEEVKRFLGAVGCVPYHNPHLYGLGAVSA